MYADIILFYFRLLNGPIQMYVIDVVHLLHLPTESIIAVNAVVHSVNNVLQK